jgi:ubiquinone/menaquinone biosynthesis C-methylase UbiE
LSKSFTDYYDIIMQLFERGYIIKPANDPNINYRDLVRQAYDSCAAVYDESRASVAPPELNLLTDRLENGAAILDIGCGAGVPIASTLSGSYSLTGVDISGGMISRARANVPSASFVEGDVMSVSLPPSGFGAAVAFYSVFNISREEHPALLRRVHRWLKNGGYLMTTFSFNDDGSYTGDFFGVTMYWSNFGLEEYYNLLARTGFKILETTAIGGGYRDREKSAAERHPLVLAKKL